EVDADLDVLVLHPEGLGEAGQTAERSFRQILGLGVQRKTQQGQPQLRSEDARKRALLRRLHAECMDSDALRIVPHAVEEYRLPDASESHHEHALRRTPESYALDGNTHGPPELIAASQLGGAYQHLGRTGSRRGPSAARPRRPSSPESWRWSCSRHAHHAALGTSSLRTCELTRVRHAQAAGGAAGGDASRGAGAARLVLCHFGDADPRS